MFQLITIFFEGMNERSRTRMIDYSNSKLIKMDPEEAWEMLDKVTNFDASYAPRKKKGVYMRSHKRLTEMLELNSNKTRLTR